MKSDSLIVQLLNVQGLSREKKYAIEELIGKQDKKGVTITGLVETHQIEDKYNWHHNYEVIEKRRSSTDKKGGGLMMIIRRDNAVTIDRIDTRNTDILFVKGKIENIKSEDSRGIYGNRKLKRKP